MSGALYCCAGLACAPLCTGAAECRAAELLGLLRHAVALMPAGLLGAGSMHHPMRMQSMPCSYAYLLALMFLIDRKQYEQVGPGNGRWAGSACFACHPGH